MAGRLLVLLLLGTPLIASAQTRPTPGRSPHTGPVTVGSVDSARATLARWFSGYEFVPKARDYRRLKPHLGGALEALVRDPGLDLVLRARAVSAMVYAADADSHGFVSALLADESAPSLLRRKAALVLGERAGADATASLVSAFTAAYDDVFVREACARALRQLGPGAYAARERLLIGETAPSVRALLRAGKRVGETP